MVDLEGNKVLHYNASRRGVYTFSTNKNSPKPYFCSEPTPDIGLNSQIEGMIDVLSKGSAKVSGSESAVELKGRTERILFLREAFFRLCEMNINYAETDNNGKFRSGLSPQDYYEIFKNILLTSVLLDNKELTQPGSERALELIQTLFKIEIKKNENELNTDAFEREVITIKDKLRQIEDKLKNRQYGISSSIDETKIENLKKDIRNLGKYSKNSSEIEEILSVLEKEKQKADCKDCFKELVLKLDEKQPAIIKKIEGSDKKGEINNLFKSIKEKILQGQYLTGKISEAGITSLKDDLKNLAEEKSAEMTSINDKIKNESNKDYDSFAKSLSETLKEKTPEIIYRNAKVLDRINLLNRYLDKIDQIKKESELILEQNKDRRREFENDTLKEQLRFYKQRLDEYRNNSHTSSENKSGNQNSINILSASSDITEKRNHCRSISVPSILFEPDTSFTLKPGYGHNEAVLRAVKQFLRTNPDCILAVSGHTNSNGEELYNDKLSCSRANAVKNHLKEFSDRIYTFGKGENDLIFNYVAGKRLEDKNRSRRAEFKFYSTQEKFNDLKAYHCN